MNELIEEYSSFLAPISEDNPCGDNLEYENDYVLLLAKVEPKDSVQYGDFVSEKSNIAWGEVAEDVELLFTRTKDVRLVILWIRAQVYKRGAQGLFLGLNLLYELLVRYPDEVYPTLVQEGERDEMYRASALNELINPDGLVKEIRQITLGQNASVRIKIREIDYALTHSRASDAMPISSVVQYINVLNNEKDAAYIALTHAHALLEQMQVLFEEQMLEYAPNLDTLIKLLQWFASEPPSILIKHGLHQINDQSESASQKAQDINETTVTASLSSHHTIRNRMEVRQLILQAQQWFEINEPSSPVALLLHQAQQLIGRPFEEIFQAIPPELVQQWRINQKQEHEEEDV